MPEFVEVEAYRRTVLPLVGRRIECVVVADPRLLRRGTPIELVRATTDDAAIGDARRIGKLLSIDLENGHRLALSFGLRGWLTLDEQVAAATGDGPWRRRPPRAEHVRLTIDVDGRRLELEDLLRLATLEIDVDEDRLGVDVLALDRRRLGAIVGSSRAAIKSVLMDQARIAGIGNLIADEICWQAGVDPRRSSSDLDGAEVDRLWEATQQTRTRVLEHGGSHHGELIQRDGRELGRQCPRCGGPMHRTRVGSRTTFFCAQHQR